MIVGQVRRNTPSGYECVKKTRKMESVTVFSVICLRFLSYRIINEILLPFLLIRMSEWEQREEGCVCVRVCESGAGTQQSRGARES